MGENSAVMAYLANPLMASYRLYDVVVSDLVPKISVKMSPTSHFSISPYALHYAVIEKIEGFVDWFIETHKEFLNVATSVGQLTPVHLAAITAASGDFGALKILEKLIAAGVNLNAQDAGGWTPLHHAALWRHPYVITLFKEAHANQTVISKTGGTYQNILGLLGWNEKEPSDPIDLYGEQKGVKLTGRKFQELTGARFVNEMQCTPHQLLSQWRWSHEHVPVGQSFLFTNSILSKLTIPPIHQMKKVIQDSSGHPLSHSPGYGLFAATNLNPGDYIGEYLGAWEDYLTPSPYSLACEIGGGIEAKDERNGIPVINDGFPNVILVPVDNYKGLQRRDFFVTSEKVQEGDQFCWNYGFSIHQKVIGPYAELRPKEARAFIKQYSVEKLAKCLERVGERVCSFEEFVIAERFRYLLGTPSVIFLMMIDQTITVKEGKALLDHSLTSNCISTYEIRSFKSIPEMAQQCINLQKKLAPYPDLARQYIGYILSLPGQFGLICAMEGTSMMNNLIEPMIGQQFFIDALSRDFSGIVQTHKMKMGVFLKGLLKRCSSKSALN